MANQQGLVDGHRRQQRHESRANQTWRAFVKELMALAKLDEEQAILAATAVLCRLEDRLTGNEARDLEAQLPVKLVELLTESCADPDLLVKMHKGEFVDAVGLDLGMTDAEAEAAIRAVFSAVRSRISDGEAQDVAAQLPRDLRPLWLHPA
jgi:uncharacterized protein (DUF2267 family)